MQFFYYNPELGPEFIKKFFGTMDIQFAKNFRQMTDWLAQGRYALCFGCKDSMRAKNQGLPVEDFETTKWKEGSSFSSGGGSLSFLNQAPHPNAAKVFINWFLSRRGQIALQKLGDVDEPPNSRRIDIPKDDVPPANRMAPDGKYFDVVKPEYCRFEAGRRSHQGDHGGQRSKEVVEERLRPWLLPAFYAMLCRMQKYRAIRRLTLACPWGNILPVKESSSKLDRSGEKSRMINRQSLLDR